MGKHAKLQTQRNSRKESENEADRKEAEEDGERKRGQQTITSNFRAASTIPLFQQAKLQIH